MHVNNNNNENNNDNSVQYNNDEIKIVQQTHLLSYIFVGDNKVGKTKLIESFKTRKFQEGYKQTCTSECSLDRLQYDNKSITLQLWDTSCTDLDESYFYSVDIIILMYDSSIPFIDQTKKLNVLYQKCIKNKLEMIPPLDHHAVQQKLKEKKCLMALCGAKADTKKLLNSNRKLYNLLVAHQANFPLGVINLMIAYTTNVCTDAIFWCLDRGISQDYCHETSAKHDINGSVFGMFKHLSIEFIEKYKYGHDKKGLTKAVAAAWMDDDEFNSRSEPEDMIGTQKNDTKPSPTPHLNQPTLAFNNANNAPSSSKFTFWTKNNINTCRFNNHPILSAYPSLNRLQSDDPDRRNRSISSVSSIRTASVYKHSSDEFDNMQSSDEIFDPTKTTSNMLPLNYSSSNSRCFSMHSDPDIYQNKELLTSQRLFRHLSDNEMFRDYSRSRSTKTPMIVPLPSDGEAEDTIRDIEIDSPQGSNTDTPQSSGRSENTPIINKNKRFSFKDDDALNEDTQARKIIEPSVLVLYIVGGFLSILCFPFVLIYVLCNCRYSNYKKKGSGSVYTDVETPRLSRVSLISGSISEIQMKACDNFDEEDFELQLDINENNIQDDFMLQLKGQVQNESTGDEIKIIESTEVWSQEKLGDYTINDYTTNEPTWTPPIHSPTHTPTPHPFDPVRFEDSSTFI